MVAKKFTSAQALANGRALTAQEFAQVVAEYKETDRSLSAWGLRSARAAFAAVNYAPEVEGAKPTAAQVAKEMGTTGARVSQQVTEIGMLRRAGFDLAWTGNPPAALVSAYASVVALRKMSVPGDPQESTSDRNARNAQARNLVAQSVVEIADDNTRAQVLAANVAQAQERAAQAKKVRGAGTLTASEKVAATLTSNPTAPEVQGVATVTVPLESAHQQAMRQAKSLCDLLRAYGSTFDRAQVIALEALTLEIGNLVEDRAADLDAATSDAPEMENA